jgi:hypothetical protein
MNDVIELFPAGATVDDGGELAARWPDAPAIFAPKAFPCTAALRALDEEGLGRDVAVVRRRLRRCAA